MMESNLNSIIQDTIERLMSQRDDLITAIRNQDEHKINSHERITELNEQVILIDNKIDSYLDRLK